MSYYIVYLQKDGTLHNRNYTDENYEIAKSDLEEITQNPLVAAAMIVDDAYDSKRANVIATKQWLDDGTLAKEGLV